MNIAGASSSSYGGRPVGAGAGSSSGAAGAGAGARFVSTVEEYAWERTYERTWESIQEDESGLLKTDAGAARRKSYRDEEVLSNVQRGMLRNVFLIIDFSRAMEQSGDLKPNRAVAVSKAVNEFVQEYFESNPISQLGIIISRNGLADKVTDLSGNPKKHISAYDAALNKTANSLAGDFTFQTSLDVACRTLSLQPRFGTREVVIIHGALSTRDPGAISDTIAMLKKEKVRVSVISIPGEVYVASRIAKETNGSYSVPEHYDSLRSMLLSHCQPPPRRKEDVDLNVKMVKVGFPELVQENEGLCSCHKMLMPRAYVCPQCHTRCCEIPTECAVCKLQLVSAPGLARSYHHIFPVQTFVEVPSAHEPGYYVDKSARLSSGSRGGGSDAGASSGAMEVDAAAASVASSPSAVATGSGGGGVRRVPIHNTSAHCGGCLTALAAEQSRYVCPACRLGFCGDCDQLIHETLHNCPGCAAA